MTHPATALARDVISQLIQAGVSEIVVAPGSRNAPLSFAAFTAAEAGSVRLHTRIDERSAGFLALGLTRENSRAAVICTSGTAVANLHPAALEAVHADYPLVIVTADRPARLRGTMANQTTDQVGIFGPLIPTVDLIEPTPLDLTATGPTHLNVQLDDPLVESTDWTPPPALPRERRGMRWSTGEPLAAGDRTVVIAGDDAGPPPRLLAQDAGWPLFAEPSSGARTGANALRTYRHLLDTELGHSIDRAVVFGRPTLSRPIQQVLGRAGVDVLVVPHRGPWSQPPYAATLIDRPGAPDVPADSSWLQAWQDADRAQGRAIDQLLAAEPDLTPYAAVAATHRALPPEGLLIVGASNPIRDLDLMARPTPVGERRKIIANRGLSGIDGVVSTAIGAALGRASSARAIALVGDVTFLHDSNGLILGPHEPRPDLTFVVINDDGGSIFAVLEQGAADYADRFERLFATPHGVDLASLCAATRTPHLKVTSAPELEHALASPNGGIEVIEVQLRRDNRRELDQRLRELS